VLILMVSLTMFALVFTIGAVGLAHTGTITGVNKTMTADLAGENNTGHHVSIGPAASYSIFKTDINSTGTMSSMAIDNNRSTRHFLTYNNHIMPGQTIRHQALVNDNSATLSVYVQWQNSQDDFMLTIFMADGQTLGPYYDSSDGSRDDQIYLNVINQKGVVAGTWFFQLTDKGEAKSDDYLIRTWQ
jgi:hypothetical protein